MNQEGLIVTVYLITGIWAMIDVSITALMWPASFDCRSGLTGPPCGLVINLED